MNLQSCNGIVNFSNEMSLDWTGADEDQGDVNVWEDNWDDDNIEDDFSQQLRLIYLNGSIAIRFS